MPHRNPAPGSGALTLGTRSGLFQLLLSRFLSGFFLWGVGVRGGQGREAGFFASAGPAVIM